MRDERRMTIQRFLQGLISFRGHIPFELNGALYLIYLRDLHDFDAFRDNCIKDAYRTAAFIRPGMTVVDVGGHIGTFTLMAAARVGERGKVFSFEPEKSNFASLTKNVELNHLSQATAFNNAVSDNSGHVNFYLSEDSEGHSLIKENGPVSAVTSADVVTLDQLPLRRVDLLKIDAEGSELAVLRGAQKLLRSNPNIVLIIEDSPAHSKEELASYLASLHFTIDAFNYFIVARASQRNEETHAA